jgi:hypothetical protein
MSNNGEMHVSSGGVADGAGVQLAFPPLSRAEGYEVALGGFGSDLRVPSSDGVRSLAGASAAPGAGSKAAHLKSILDFVDVCATPSVVCDKGGNIGRDIKPAPVWLKRRQHWINNCKVSIDLAAIDRDDADADKKSFVEQVQQVLEEPANCESPEETEFVSAAIIGGTISQKPVIESNVVTTKAIATKLSMPLARNYIICEKLWHILSLEGWIAEKGIGHGTWHYLSPKAQQIKPSVRTRGVDYFTSKDEVLAHATAIANKEKNRDDAIVKVQERIAAHEDLMRKAGMSFVSAFPTILPTLSKPINTSDEDNDDDDDDDDDDSDGEDVCWICPYCSGENAPKQVSCSKCAAVREQVFDAAPAPGAPPPPPPASTTSGADVSEVKESDATEWWDIKAKGWSGDIEPMQSGSNDGASDQLMVAADEDIEHGTGCTTEAPSESNQLSVYKDQPQSNSACALPRHQSPYHSQSPYSTGITADTTPSAAVLHLHTSGPILTTQVHAPTPIATAIAATSTPTAKQPERVQDGIEDAGGCTDAAGRHMINDDEDDDRYASYMRQFEHQQYQQQKHMEQQVVQQQKQMEQQVVQQQKQMEQQAVQQQKQMEQQVVQQQKQMEQQAVQQMEQQVAKQMEQQVAKQFVRVRAASSARQFVPPIATASKGTRDEEGCQDQGGRGQEKDCAGDKNEKGAPPDSGNDQEDVDEDDTKDGQAKDGKEKGGDNGSDGAEGYEGEEEEDDAEEREEEDLGDGVRLVLPLRRNIIKLRLPACMRRDELVSRAPSAAFDLDL